jgi:tetratricopeptide (TPR) repeat protein
LQELSLIDVFSQIEEAFKANNISRVEALLWPAVEQFPDIAQFWFYGGCVFFKSNRPAIAAQLFRKAIELEDSPHIYSNLGACLRRMNLHEQGLTVLRAALDRDADYAPALVNIGSMYVNEGCPQEGIPYLERAVKIGTERGANWNLGLLYLESARFGEGFDCYRAGVAHERLVRTFSTDKTREPALLPVDFKLGSRRPTLIVWGEQGIGDELMFGSILEDARKDFDITLECHPRLVALHAQAHPGLNLYPTRKDSVADWYDGLGLTIEYKCGIGDLGALYRRSAESFTHTPAPYQRIKTPETLNYRASLLELAEGRPIVGLATRGGVMSTARTYRTLRPADVDRLFSETEAMFVSFDYDDMTGFADYIDKKFGENRYKWFPSIVQHYDFHHTADLLHAMDLTVTVCQSVAHLAAGMGLPVRVLTPKRVAWRYAPVPGLSEDLWFWYQNPVVRLYRQDDPDSWVAPMGRVIRDIQELRK